MIGVVRSFLISFLVIIALAVPAAATSKIDTLRHAAEAGNVEAQNDLAWAYLTGNGIPQNYDEAFKWFTRAAEKGYPIAQTNLGRMYADGHGTEMNFAEAERWYRRAAAQGNPMGQFNLGFMYAKAIGVPQNAIEAYQWLTLASPKLKGKERVIAEQELKEVGSHMTGDQLSEAKRRVSNWKPKPE